MKPLYLILLLALGLLTSCESEEDKLQAAIEKEKLALEQWKVNHKALTTKRSALSLERQKLQGDRSSTIRRKEQEYRLETMSQCQKELPPYNKNISLKSTRRNGKRRKCSSKAKTSFWRTITRQ